MSKLKACPFCGHGVELIKALQKWITCNNEMCGCSYHYRGMKPETDSEQIKSIINEWNGREV